MRRVLAASVGAGAKGAHGDAWAAHGHVALLMARAFADVDGLG